MARAGMGIIKASKLIFEYIRRDEDDRVEAVRSEERRVWKEC